MGIEELTMLEKFPVKNSGFVETFIENLIEEKIRPLIQSDGGDIEFINYSYGTKVLTVKLTGACAHCPSSNITLFEGVQKMINDELPPEMAIEVEQEF